MNATAAPSRPPPTPVALDHLVLPLARVRAITAACLAAGGLLVFAGVAATPRDDGGTAGFHDALAAHPGQSQIGDLLLHFGWTGAVLACFGLALLGLGRRGPLLLAGCLLAALGLTAMPGIFATDAYDLALAQELPRAASVAISEQASGSVLASVLFITGTLGAALGPAVLLAALWRQRIVGPAPWILMIAGPLVSVAGGHGWSAVLGAGLLAAGYCWAAVELRRAVA